MNPAFEKPQHAYDHGSPQLVTPGVTRETMTSPAPTYYSTAIPQMTAQPTSAHMNHTQHWQQQPVMQQEKGFNNPQQVAVHETMYRQAVPIASLGRTGAPVDCPTCGQRKMTAISYQSGNSTHVWAGALCLLTGLFCFIPYLMNSTKNVEHKCGHCGRVLAIVHKSGQVEQHAYH